MVWVEIPKIQNISGWRIIDLWSVSWESIVLAAAVYKMVELFSQSANNAISEDSYTENDVKDMMAVFYKKFSDLHVVLLWENNWSHVLNWGKLIPARIEKNRWAYCLSDTFLRKDNAIPHWNSYGFSRYSSDKYLSWKILQQEWVNIPKELMFRKIARTSNYDTSFEEELENYVKKATRRFEQVKDFLWNLESDSEIVLKARRWAQWDDIYFFTVQEILDAWDYIKTYPETFMDDEEYEKGLDSKFEMLRIAIWYGEYILQERIISYPLEMNGEKKDWNLRVLTTYSPSKNKYIVVGMTWRVDNDWWPVNRSISAENISLEDICKYAWIEDQYNGIYDRVEKLSIQAVESIVKAWAKKINHLWLEDNWQDLAGIDVIVDPNLEAYVIETNNADSWCLYELTELEWPNGVNPIADSIVWKLLRNFILEQKNAKSVYDYTDLPLEGKYDLHSIYPDAIENFIASLNEVDESILDDLFEQHGLDKLFVENDDED